MITEYILSAFCIVCLSFLYCVYYSTPFFLLRVYAIFFCVYESKGFVDKSNRLKVYRSLPETLKCKLVSYPRCSYFIDPRSVGVNLY